MPPKKIKRKFSKEPVTIQKQALQISEESHFKGPLPPPAVLQDYDIVITDGAERIMAMAEKQSAHRIEQESRVIRANTRDSLLGIVSGLTISISAFIVAGIGFYLGHPAAAATICTVDLAAIVGVFVYGTKNK